MIRRTGTINAYRSPEFRVALEATGRRKVTIAGVSTTTCLQFPALDMVADGHDVYGVIDASGSESLIAREAAVATLVHSGWPSSVGDSRHADSNPDTLLLNWSNRRQSCLDGGMALERTESLDAEARLESLHRRRPQALAQAIEEEIAVRGHPPGTRLGTKAELRARFGVATTTVNEAIRVLEHRGVVRSRPGPGGGVFTAERSQWLTLSQLVLDFKHSAAAVAEVLAVRDVLESLIAAEAARHHRARDLARLRTLVEEMGRHVNEPSAYLHSNWAFHRHLAKLCPNEFARALYEGLLEFAERNLAGVAGRGEFDGAANLAVHLELVEAIAARDLERTEKAVQRHNDASRVIRD